MHDIHIHTTLSKCAKEDAQFSDYQSKFKDLSLTVVGFTNHLWDKNVANASLWYTGQDVEHVLKLKEDKSILINHEETINNLIAHLLFLKYQSYHLLILLYWYY